MTRPGRFALARPRPTAGGTDYDDGSAVHLTETTVQDAITELSVTRPPTHTSSSDPTTGDDSGDGHVIGCRWINTSTDEEFVALDVSVGAAVWESTTAGGGGSTIEVEDEGTNEGTVDTLNFTGAGVSITVTGSEAEVIIPGGGGGGDPWDLVIDEDGSSFANWTARDGTWASTSGEIRQTNTGAAEYNAHYTASVIPMSLVLAEVEVWIPAANSTDDYIGMDVGIDSANTTNRGARIYLKRSGTSLVVAAKQSGAENVSASVTVNTDTWYTLRALVSGTRIAVWLDGTARFTGDFEISEGLIPYFGLFTALSTGHFRNVRVWVPIFPA